jgi:hypothetical protein
MRRLDIHPRKKLRNPARHARALSRWPDRLAAQLPNASAFAGERFCNFKVAVFQKLVDPPHATVQAQRACIAAIFAAAEAIESSTRRPPACRVACLVTTPYLFDSEVTIFFDEAYFESFLPIAEVKRTDFDGGWIEAGPQDPSAIQMLAPPAPKALAFFGGTLLREFDPAWGAAPIERSNWVWAFPRR